VPDKYEPFDATQIAAMPAFQNAKSGPDQTWVDRIANMPVGAGFRVYREEGETPMQMKRRISTAAKVHFKELEWKPEQIDLPQGQNPTSWVVRIKAIDLKAKAEAEARQNGSNASAQPPQTTSTTSTDTSTSDTAETAGGPRRPR
jgi:hypothetical protein